LGYLPITWKAPSSVTIFSVDKPAATGVSYNPFPVDVHEDDVRVVKPVITGFAPVPYALKAIGADELPDIVTVILPGKTSPLLKRTRSPGCKLLKKELSLLNVFHGVDAL
jgi:hypothetical protein